MYQNQNTYHIVGLMSGSSLDGLDIAYCQFNFTEGNWNFTLLQSKAVSLGEWEIKLKNAIALNNKELDKLSLDFASFMAKEVKLFLKEFSIERLDAIASHGHTIYHYPEKGKTCQIGDGQILANEAGISVVCNLRQKDMDLGGQGAPIVPIGDLKLFKEHQVCINLGGIANISIKEEDRIVAFDICPANQVLNHYANQLGKSYDDKGAFARKGRINSILLKALNEQRFYSLEHPKSLDNGFAKELISLVESVETDELNVLRTYTEHIADQISLSMKTLDAKESALITGGGAFNDFLIERIQDKLNLSVYVPKEEIINYKEAIVMAFIGVLKLRNEVNVLASVTGAKNDTCCGDYFSPLI